MFRFSNSNEGKEIKKVLKEYSVSDFTKLDFYSYHSGWFTFLTDKIDGVQIQVQFTLLDKDLHRLHDFFTLLIHDEYLYLKFELYLQMDDNEWITPETIEYNFPHP